MIFSWGLLYSHPSVLINPVFQNARHGLHSYINNLENRLFWVCRVAEWGGEGFELPVCVFTKNPIL